MKNYMFLCVSSIACVGVLICAVSVLATCYCECHYCSVVCEQSAGNGAVYSCYDPPIAEIIWSYNPITATPESCFVGEISYAIDYEATCECFVLPDERAHERQADSSQIEGGGVEWSPYPQYCNHCLPPS